MNSFRTAFLDMVAAIAENLADEWDLKPNPGDWAVGATLTATTGVILYMRPGRDFKREKQMDPEKIHITSELPKNSKGETPWVQGYGRLGKQMPSINVSFSKTPTQIAREIERRLLTECLPIAQEALRKIAESDAYHDKTESFAAKIAQLAGVEAKGNKVDFYRSPEPTLHETVSRAEVGDDHVALELRLSYEDTLKVLRVLIKNGR